MFFTANATYCPLLAHVQVTDRPNPYKSPFVIKLLNEHTTIYNDHVFSLVVRTLVFLLQYRKLCFSTRMMKAFSTR